MKEGIHPTYEPTTFKCICGFAMDIRSTRSDLKVELCSNCHPFYTGKHKLIDTEGRVEKFKKKYGLKEK
jgi:large subunit ribosomal protein L31